MEYGHVVASCCYRAIAMGMFFVFSTAVSLSPPIQILRDEKISAQIP